MVKCTSCGKPVRANLRECPHCGLISPKVNYSKDLTIDDLVLLGIIALFAMP